MPADVTNEALQDEEAELLAELERIKKERAEDAARKQKEEDAEKESQLREEVARGNPLLNNQDPAFQVSPTVTSALRRAAFSWHGTSVTAASDFSDECFDCSS